MKEETQSDLRINNGGKREGAGRPGKFKDPVTYGLRMEREDREAIKEKFGSKFNQILRNWIKGLLKDDSNE